MTAAPRAEGSGGELWISSCVLEGAVTARVSWVCKWQPRYLLHRCAGRPEALRPRLSTGLPTVRAQLRSLRLLPVATPSRTASRGDERARHGAERCRPQRDSADRR